MSNPTMKLENKQKLRE